MWVGTETQYTVNRHYIGVGDGHYTGGTDTIQGGTETLYKVRSNLKMLT